MEARRTDKGKDGNPSTEHTPEEEPVRPDVASPLSPGTEERASVSTSSEKGRGNALKGLGLHAEKRATHVHHLEREDEGEPGEHGEGGAARAEDVDRAVADAVVRVDTEVAVVEAKDDEGETGEAKCGAEGSVDGHVDNNLPGKDSDVELR